MRFSFVQATATAILLTCLTGCLTSHMAMDRAKGYDTFPPRTAALRHQREPRLSPNPAYQALLALTVPFDLITFPIQAPLLVWLLGQRV